MVIRGVWFCHRHNLCLLRRRPEVVTATFETLPTGRTHWSSRGMAKAAGRRPIGLRPHLGQIQVSNGPKDPGSQAGTTLLGNRAGAFLASYSPCPLSIWAIPCLSFFGHDNLFRRCDWPADSAMLLILLFFLATPAPTWHP
jgi:hypothetical protein